MRKFIIFLAMFFMLPVLADTQPYYMNNVPKSSIGLYQTGENLIVYSEPDPESKVLRVFDFSYEQESMPDGVFAVLINSKKLGLMYVTDVGDDNWVEVIYDKHLGAKGWVQTEDKFQFLPWISFYNMYGRKYGLRLFKDTPNEVETLHAKSDDLSQNVGKLNYAKKIRVVSIRGNWALVSVYDLDKTLKTGYLKWRNTDGTIYAFPSVK